MHRLPAGPTRGAARVRTFLLCPNSRLCSVSPPRRSLPSSWVTVASLGTVVYSLRHPLGPCPPKQPHRGLGTHEGRALWPVKTLRLSLWLAQSPLQMLRTTDSKAQCSASDTQKLRRHDNWVHVSEENTEMDVPKTCFLS